MKLKTAQELFEHELGDILNAEQQLTKALPKMAKAATDEKLAEAFETHLEETKGQIERIEKAFKALGKKAKSQTCDAMKGLLKEGEKLMEEVEEGALLDAAMIMAAQKVEHYEISTYGTLCTIAEEMGETEVARLLKQNMAEEEKTDKLLTRLAEGGINQEALREAA